MKFAFTLFLCLSVSLLSAQAFRKYSNEFLSIGVDARAFAMGNSVVAHQRDVNSGYWNPAGLTGVEESWQGALMHAEYFQSIAAYDYAAFAMPLRNGSTIGIHALRFGVDDILNTTQLIDEQGNINYDRINKFSAADYALNLSYAGYFLNNKDISVGATAKLIYRNIGKFANSFGFGMDAGIQYQTQDNFFFGAMARDITTSFNVWSVNTNELNRLELDGDVLNEAPEENIEFTPPKLQVGIGKYVEFSDTFSATAELDLLFQFQNNNDLISARGLSMSPTFGFEVAYDKMIFLRGGVNNFQWETTINNERKLNFQPNIGIGFRYKGITIDYALTNIGSTGIALYSNIFSLKLDISQFR